MPQKKTKGICDHNCFECKFLDCKCSDMATKEEGAIIRYWSTGYDARMDVGTHEDRLSDDDRKSYDRENRKAYYAANKERIIQKQREYRRKKREERRKAHE